MVRSHALLVAALLVPAGSPSELSPQPTDPSPEAVADDFLRAVEAMAWEPTARLLHPDALDRLHRSVSMLVRTDESGEILARLLGGVGRDGYEELAAAEVFTRVMTALLEEAPGLVNALVGRRHEVLGTVEEGPDRAHVVYRVVPDLTGAESELRIVTLAGGPDGWKVLQSEEMESIRTALRGIPIGAPEMPPGPGRSRPPVDLVLR